MSQRDVPAYKAKRMTDAHAKRAAYDATMNYHNTLVQSRFAVAALFMTASAFLLVAYFDQDKWKGGAITLPLLGVLLTFCIWLIELRTRHLLATLVDLGCAIERTDALPESLRFFHLIQGPQPIKMSQKSIMWLASCRPDLVRLVISHGSCLNFMYALFAAFWMYAAWLAYDPRWISIAFTYGQKP